MQCSKSLRVPVEQWINPSCSAGTQGESLTVVVGLVRVRHQPAVVWPRRHGVRDAVVVVVIVALVSLPVFVRVQLRAVDHEWAIILGVLMAVAVAAGGREDERDAFNEVRERAKAGAANANKTWKVLLLPVLVCVARVSNQVVVNVRLKQGQRVYQEHQNNLKLGFWTEAGQWFFGLPLTWLGFGMSGQLSQASPTPSPSRSSWSLFWTRWQLSKMFFRPVRDAMTQSLVISSFHWQFESLTQTWQVDKFCSLLLWMLLETILHFLFFSFFFFLRRVQE